MGSCLGVTALRLKHTEEAFQFAHVLSDRITSELAPPILEHARDLLASPRELIAVHTSLTPCGSLLHFPMVESATRRRVKTTVS